MPKITPGLESSSRAGRGSRTAVEAQTPTELIGAADLAELIGLPREDGVAWLGPVRVPTAWLAAWRVKTGPLELTAEDVAVLIGKDLRAVRWLRTSGRLRGRSRGPGKRGGPGGGYVFSAADVVLHLRGDGATVAPPAETSAQRMKRIKRVKALVARLCGDDELADQLEPERPARSRARNVTLYLTTHRVCCAAIAAGGFEEQRYGCYGPGVYLVAAPVLQFGDGPLSGPRSNANIHISDAEQVAFEFRLPNAIADQYAQGGYEYLPPNHPNFDPARDTQDPDFPDRAPPNTWVVPSDVANRYCTGLRFWSGVRPLTDDQVRTIDARREKPRRRGKESKSRKENGGQE